jgi:hypothetical protein
MLKDKKRRSSNYNLRYSVVTRGAAQAQKRVQVRDSDSSDQDLDATVEFDHLRKQCIHQMIREKSGSPLRQTQREPLSNNKYTSVYRYKQDEYVSHFYDRLSVSNKKAQNKD